MTVERPTIVVTGASGNVGAGVLRALALHQPGAIVVGVCRRPPRAGSIYQRVRWHAIDLSAKDAARQLEPAFRGADVVIHLALAVHPARDEPQLYRANVLGSQAVLDAMLTAGVPQLVYASSLGIYAPGATDAVSEDWPDTGQDTSTYSRHKVIVERILDRFVQDHPDVTVARFRPTVVVQRQAAFLIRSLYLGPFVPRAVLGLLRRRNVPALPLPAGLALQFVHADDVGDAVVRMMQQGARGSFNIASDAMDIAAVAGLVGARPLEVSPRVVRAAIVTLSALRLIALTPGWYDVATNTPVMDTARAREELGWTASRSSEASALELLGGLADGATGFSAATGRRPAQRGWRTGAQRLHDASLVVWGASTLLRAFGVRRAAAVQFAAIGANLAFGTPMALQRIQQRRRDPVALLAPVAVAGAVATSVRGGWPAVAATTVLQMVNVVEGNRIGGDAESAV